MENPKLFAALTFQLALSAASSMPMEKSSIGFRGPITASCGLKEGGFAVLERTYVTPWQNSITLHAFDSSGNRRWMSTIRKPYDGLEGNRVLQTKDGGLAILGHQSGFFISTQTDIFMKTDSLGQVVFEKARGTLSRSIDFLVETPDSGYIAAVYGSDSEEQFQSLFRLDKFGNEVWKREYQGNPDLRVSAARIASATEFLLAGNRKNTAGQKEIFFEKVDASGGVIWERILASGVEGKVHSIEPLDGGGYLLAGSMSTQDSLETDTNAVLLETDAFGFTIRWNSYGVPGWGQVQEAYSAKAMDGGWVAAGLGLNGGAEVIKTDAFGRTIWAGDLHGYATPGARYPVIVQGPGKFVVCPHQACYLFEDPEYTLP